MHPTRILPRLFILSAYTRLLLVTKTKSNLPRQVGTILGLGGSSPKLLTRNPSIQIQAELNEGFYPERQIECEAIEMERKYNGNTWSMDVHHGKIRNS